MARGSTSIAEAPAPPSALQVGGVVIGNALEFYDFLIYAYYAVYIGRAFFPSHDATVSLLASLAAFAIGFLARPLGALVFGLIGDRAGRKPAMILSFSLIGLADAGLALTPSYRVIGVGAQLLLVFFRLLQGFAVGGEVGPSTAYLLEAAPRAQRGLYASLQFASQALGSGLAALVGVALASLLSARAFGDFGWRIALMLGVLIVPFGIYLRRSLSESLSRARDAGDGVSGGLAPRRGPVRVVVSGFVMLSACSIAGYLNSYFTTYTIATLGRSAAIGFGTAVTSNTMSILLSLASGFLSDRFGRKPLMVLPGATLCLVMVPAFWVMIHVDSVFALYAGVAVLVGLSALCYAAVTIHVSESFPPETRARSIGVLYALAVTIFGGSTQFVVTWLISLTGSPLAPAVFGEVAALAGLVAMVFTRETAPARRWHGARSAVRGRTAREPSP